SPSRKRPRAVYRRGPWSPGRSSWYNCCMPLQDQIIRRVLEFPPDRQREVLDFVESPAGTAAGHRRPTRRDLLGILEGQVEPVSAKELRAVRDELWARFLGMSDALARVRHAWLRLDALVKLLRIDNY